MKSIIVAAAAAVLLAGCANNGGGLNTASQATPVFAAPAVNPAANVVTTARGSFIGDNQTFFLRHGRGFPPGRSIFHPSRTRF